MVRKVTQDDIARWKELRNKGYTFERIGSDVGWAPETIRKHIGGGERGNKEGEPETTPHAQTFQMFEEVKTPVDVVMGWIAPPGEVKTMWRDYHELKGLNPLEDRLKKSEEWIKGAKAEISCFLFLIANDLIGKPCPICEAKIIWWGKGDGVDKEGYYCSNWKNDKTGCEFRFIEPYGW